MSILATRGTWARGFLPGLTRRVNALLPSFLTGRPEADGGRLLRQLAGHDAHDAGGSELWAPHWRNCDGGQDCADCHRGHHVDHDAGAPVLLQQSHFFSHSFGR